MKGRNLVESRDSLVSTPSNNNNNTLDRKPFGFKGLDFLVIYKPAKRCLHSALDSVYCCRGCCFFCGFQSRGVLEDGLPGSVMGFAQLVVGPAGSESHLIARACFNTVKLSAGICLLCLWILLRKISTIQWHWISENSFPWMMLRRNLDWVLMVESCAAWNILKTTWMSGYRRNWTTIWMISNI